MATMKQRERLHQLLDSIPNELLGVVEDLLQRLSPLSDKSGAFVVRLGGLWRNAGLSVSETDIAQLRQELWSSLEGRGE